MPPICIPNSFKHLYNRGLNYVRANRDGDYSILMELLYNGTMTSLGVLKGLVATESMGNDILM